MTFQQTDEQKEIVCKGGDGAQTGNHQYEFCDCSDDGGRICRSLDKAIDAAIDGACDDSCGGLVDAGVAGVTPASSGARGNSWLTRTSSFRPVLVCSGCQPIVCRSLALGHQCMLHSPCTVVQHLINGYRVAMHMFI